MAEHDESDAERMEEIRTTLHQAQTMKDVLQAEYDRLAEEKEALLDLSPDPDTHEQGMEKMHKAIVALELAIASMEQGLRQRQQIQDDM
jgi:hypothetical protein